MHQETEPLTSAPGDELGNDTKTPLPPKLPDGPDDPQDTGR